MAKRTLYGTVIVTYRCNAHCNMCDCFRDPTRPEEEITLEDIKKLPEMAFTNITGGEPFIRKDIPENVADDWVLSAVKTAVGGDTGEVLHSSARNAYKVQVVERILRRTVRVLRMHLMHSQMEPDRFELHFGRTDKLEAVHLPLKDGSRMQLEGFIDRVDVCEEEDRILLRIID